MKKNSNQLPQARKDRLIVKELPDETLVYDLADEKAHCLNQTAAFVWKNCDGETSISEINASLTEKAGAPVDERVVWLALDQLEKFNLLTNVPIAPAVLQGVNRRQLIRTLGVAAVALPVIMSIAAPAALAQASGLAPGACCGSPGQCASNSCVQTPTCVGPPQPSTKACA